MITQTDALDQLSERIDALEKRVTNLEQHAGASLDESGPPAVSESFPKAASAATEPEVSGALTVIGKSLLGIAGAYLLRALAESGWAPRGLLAGIGTGYAGSWLYLAARTVRQNRLGGVLYTATSGLILAPMLWEMTLRFRVMPAWVGALLLIAYGVSVSVLAKGKDNRPVFSAGYAVCAITALALALGSHDMLPFTAILLSMAGVCEFPRLREHARTIRPIVALGAAAGVWMLLFVYRMPAQGREDYPALAGSVVLAASLVLFFLEGGSVAWRCGVQRERITFATILLVVIAFTLASLGMIWFLPTTGRGVLGLVCLGLSVLCYGTALTRMRGPDQARNFGVFTTWAVALALGGVWLLTMPASGAVVLSAFGVVSTGVAQRFDSRVLAVHGVVYLLLAAGGSGLFAYVASALAGSMPGVPAVVILVSASGVAIAYLMMRERPSRNRMVGAVRLLLALVAVCSLAAFLIRGLAGAAAMRAPLSAFQVAFARTIVLCLMGWLTAWAGTRYRRRHLVHVAYALTGFATAKLLFEDLGHGHMEYTAGSICLVALTLITVPRLARSRRAR